MEIDVTDAWMCRVDFDYELQGADGGATLFPSEENCKKHRKCCAPDENGEVDDLHYAQHVVVMTRADFDALMAKVTQ